MSKFIEGMDTSAIGENGHRQHSWESTDFEEVITKLSFQIVRTKNPGAIITKYTKTLETLKQAGPDPKYREYIAILIKMCAQTRDIISGKGEYELAYLMLKSIFQLFPTIGMALFKNFVKLEIDGKEVHPYGSWKDVKYICELFRNYPDTLNRIIDFVNQQLTEDANAFSKKEPVSLLAKWLPRENSKFGWLFERLAYQYYQHYIFHAKKGNEKKAHTACKMYYRKLVSSLNKHLDTTQIKQCSKNWERIAPERVTSVTLFRNKKAFLNVTKKGDERSSEKDRRTCAYNFEQFLEKANEGKVEVKGARVGLTDFAKEALDIIGSKRYRVDKSEEDILNLQWKNNSKQNFELGNLVAMVDVSGSMDGDPLHAAISLGIRVAEKSKLGKRVLTFTSKPKWVNLEGIDKFTDMVEKVKDSDWGMSTNFQSALAMILEVIVKQKMSVQEVKEINLIIFSDMMINQGDANYSSMYDMIERNYADAGMKVCGEPYSPPHIIFWNLRSTSGFPNMAKQKNTSMVSGFSPMLLNLFCEKGPVCLDNLTPWELLKESINNPRYSVLDEVISNM